MRCIIASVLIPTALATTSYRVPIRWSPVPQIEIIISSENLSTVNQWVTVTTRSIVDESVSLQIHDPSCSEPEQIVAHISLVRYSPQLVWMEDVVCSSDDAPPSQLRISPMSEFSYAVFSIAFTPTGLMINDHNSRNNCRYPESLRFFAGIADDDNWGFHINNQQYIIDTTEDHIVLSETDNTMFWSIVDEIFNENQISMTEDHLIFGCDLELLDDILPTFSFLINDRRELEIQISPRAYIQELVRDGIPACYIAVRPDTFLVIGTPLFQNHTVIFETDTAMIGICESVPPQSYLILSTSFFHSVFVPSLSNMFLSSLYYAISIQWSVDLLPHVLVTVGSEQPSLRLLDTDGNTPIIVHDPSFLEPFRIDENVSFDTRPRISFQMPVARANFPNAPQVLPIRPRSWFATAPITDGFMITPKYFLPVVRNFRISEFCIPGSSLVTARAHIESGWELETMAGNRARIDSTSTVISLPNYDRTIADILLALEVVGYTYSYDAATASIIINDCDVSALDELLPTIRISVERVLGGFSELVFEPRDYLVNVQGATCRLGLALSADSNYRLGSALFRKYALSFSNRNRSISFCLGK